KLADLIIAISIVFILIILSASILFYVEHTLQPNEFSSIPESMWWAVCTLTTIGYGDLVPITVMGRFMTAFIAILSIVIIALPAAMLVTGYSEVTARFKKKKRGFNITRQNILKA
ncbi:MAG: two pore domain potassium channel family protein, partial [Caldisericia bacterium]|nr:two pore domain potassium channel family protein [Caldisericia bacterium]